MKDLITELLETPFTPKDLIKELLETLFTPTDDDMEKWKEIHSSFAKMNEEEKAFAITVVSSEAFQQEITEGLKLVRDGLNAILEMPAPEKIDAYEVINGCFDDICHLNYLKFKVKI